MSSTITVHVNQISAATSEGVARDHTVLIDRPVAKNGEDRGAMGGELLLVSLGGCFMSNLLAAIKAREADISDVKIAVSGTLESNPSHFSAMHMQISASTSDTTLLEKLVTISERSCIVRNTLKDAVNLTITVAN